MSYQPNFIYKSSCSRVIFGRGAIRKLPDEIARQRLSAPLILLTSGQRNQATVVEEALNGDVAGIFDQAVMHTPTGTTEKAIAYAKLVKADSVVSFGGGGTIGLGKAISIRTGLPHICIPTTYTGSDMTPILGETTNGRKMTRSDPKILPGTVIYDVVLTMTLPSQFSVTSGINALPTQDLVEALYAQDRNPIIDLLSVEGIKALVESLPIIKDSPLDIDARLKAQYGAWLCGLSLGSVGMSLHHKLCHTIGGSFNMPHAETHTTILPHALAHNAPTVPEAMGRLADVLPESNGEAIRGLNNLLARLNVTRNLKAFGFEEDYIGIAADIVLNRQPLVSHVVMH